MSTIKIRMWQVGGTSSAYLLSTTPKENREGKQVWIPRSVIEHVTRQPTKVNEWQEIVITLPEWIAEKKGLI